MKVLGGLLQKGWAHPCTLCACAKERITPWNDSPFPIHIKDSNESFMTEPSLAVSVSAHQTNTMWRGKGLVCALQDAETESAHLWFKKEPFALKHVDLSPYLNHNPSRVLPIDGDVEKHFGVCHDEGKTRSVCAAEWIPVNAAAHREAGNVRARGI